MITASIIDDLILDIPAKRQHAEMTDDAEAALRKRIIELAYGEGLSLFRRLTEYQTGWVKGEDYAPADHRSIYPGGTR